MCDSTKVMLEILEHLLACNPIDHEFLNIYYQIKEENLRFEDLNDTQKSYFTYASKYVLYFVKDKSKEIETFIENKIENSLV